VFTLDRSRNDTSLALDLLRAVAAQTVCVGHAVNFAFLGPNTNAPSYGVLLFFILSGFVIAFTLDTKSTADGGYGLVDYGIERVCRIYCAYLPAMLLFAAVELALRAGGLHGDPSGPITGHAFVKNLLMLQGYPAAFGAEQFGLSGQTTTIAAEFHIYFFVGGLYFFAVGRARLLALLVAVAFARMPLGYFLGLEARNLFVLWLAGFAGYFVMRQLRLDAAATAMLALAAIGVAALGDWPFLAGGDAYALANYPPLVLAFIVLVAATQQTRLLAARSAIGKAIRFLADYSRTLFLVHLVLVRAIYLLWPDHGWGTVAAAIIGVNLFAAALAQATEVHYKTVARWIQRRLPHPAAAAAVQPGA
jgi:peptidoglycan/LPS O-acetylase OafA/YrhL